jgi:hypothetical protein
VHEARLTAFGTGDDETSLSECAHHLARREIPAFIPTLISFLPGMKKHSMKGRM